MTPFRPLFGVDQGNRAQMLEIMDREFGDAPLDLVVDDASHLYEETKASLEVLLPRVRPGGLFIIEDWAADYMRYGWVTTAINQPSTENAARLEKRIGDVIEPRAEGLGPFPLHRLAAEFMQICFHDTMSSRTCASTPIGSLSEATPTSILHLSHRRPHGQLAVGPAVRRGYKEPVTKSPATGGRRSLARTRTSSPRWRLPSASAKS